MAATNYSYFDIGACNCVAVCTASPCNLPKTNLHASWLLGGSPRVFTLVYKSPCTWEGCESFFGHSYTIVVSGPTTVFTYGVGCPYTGGGITFGCPPCTGFGVLFTCSPLNIVITYTGTNIITITL